MLRAASTVSKISSREADVNTTDLSGENAEREKNDTIYARAGVRNHNKQCFLRWCMISASP